MRFNGHMALGFAFFAALPPLVEKYSFPFGKALPSVEKMVIPDGSRESVTLTIAAALVTIFGAYVPDLDLKLKVFYGKKGNKRYLYHRQLTHSLALWIGAWIYGAATGNPWVIFFSTGGLSHLFGDMLTGSVPVFLWGKHYNFFTRIGIDRFIFFVDGKRRTALFSAVADAFEKISPIVFFLSVGFYVSRIS